MGYRRRIYLTEKQKADIWDRWQRGESMSSIGRRFNRNSSSIYPLLARTDEPSALQTLREQALPLTVPPDHLDQIAATTAKDKQMAGIRVLAKNRLSQR